MNKNVVVLFSGGLDSTYLVWKNLKDGNIVTPIYIEVKNNEIKVKLEEYYSKKLMELFKEEYGDKIKPLKTIMSVDLFESGDYLNFKQVPIWIFGMVFINSGLYDEIQVGYVIGDDAIGYVSDIEHIYHSFNRIMSEQLPLKFPLIKILKYDIINWLPKKYIDLTYSCENPKIIKELDNGYDFELCGDCPACKKIIHSNKFGHGLNKKELLLKEKIYHDELVLINNKIKYTNGDEPIKDDGKQLKLDFDYFQPKSNDTIDDYDLKTMANELTEVTNKTKEKIFKE